MGAQRDDPEARNYDSQAGGDEGPVHEVALSPFFLSKYEMTQGQWQHVTGGNPSTYGPERYSTRSDAGRRGWSALHPVEQVSWYRSLESAQRMDLTLPSEAQWEYGCRAGTNTVYGGGDDPKSLQGVANLADDYARQNGGSQWHVEPWLNDGHLLHGEVGSYRPNGFGLHDVHGNVWEWCLDGYDEDFYGRRVGRDPRSDPSGSLDRVCRGGSYSFMAVAARSANRLKVAPEVDGSAQGLRPARELWIP